MTNQRRHDTPRWEPPHAAPVFLFTARFPPTGFIIYIGMATTKRAALLVRCSKEEAEAIREAAQREHRTISGFIINAVMGRIQSAAWTDQAAKAETTKTA